LEKPVKPGKTCPKKAKTCLPGFCEKPEVFPNPGKFTQCSDTCEKTRFPLEK
jgi:hypothetical protein